MKIGNNEKCKCGSNLKYKKCCRDKDREEMRLSVPNFNPTYAHQTEEQKDYADSLENEHIAQVKENSKLIPEIEKLLDFEIYRKAIGVKELKDSDKVKICDSILITHYMEELDKLKFSSFKASNAPFVSKALNFLNENKWKISKKSMMENILELLSMTTSKKIIQKMLEREIHEIILVLSIFNSEGREAAIEIIEGSNKI